MQGDPVFMRRLNGWLTIFWIAMIPVSAVFGWLNSVAYVSALALWGLVSAHWSSWQAARIEVAHERAQAELAANPVEDRVVDALLEKTDLEPTAE